MNATGNLTTDSKPVQRWEIVPINYLIPSIIGFVLNPLSIFLILKRSPASLKPYIPILLMAAFVDGYVIIIQFISQLEFRTMQKITYATVIGPAKYLPADAQVIVYILVQFAMSLEITFLLLEFWFRYRFLKTKNIMSTKRLLGLMLIALIVCFSQAPLITIYWSSIVRYRDSNEWWPVDNPSVIVINGDPQNGDVLNWSRSYKSVVSLSSFFLSGFVALLSVRVMKKEVTTMSKKTKNLLNQFTNTLIARLVLFGCPNVLPHVVTQITKILGLETISFTNVFISLYIYLPIFNAFFSLYFIKPFRMILLGSTQGCLKVLSLQPQPSTSVIRVQTVTRHITTHYKP
ncbi:hypothetical protein M3Y95_01204600 [Aphelenchoides besseyi]|nr:hypothetical protein M3Y95_01204600 [Aphelenchoides besseyi]